MFSGDGSRFTRRGTYKVKRGKSEDNKENNGDQMNVPSIRISKPGEGKAQRFGSLPLTAIDKSKVIVVPVTSCHGCRICSCIWSEKK